MALGEHAHVLDRVRTVAWFCAGLACCVALGLMLDRAAHPPMAYAAPAGPEASTTPETAPAPSPAPPALDPGRLPSSLRLEVEVASAIAEVGSAELLQPANLLARLGDAAAATDRGALGLVLLSRSRGRDADARKIVAASLSRAGSDPDVRVALLRLGVELDALPPAGTDDALLGLARTVAAARRGSCADPPVPVTEPAAVLLEADLDAACGRPGAALVTLPQDTGDPRHPLAAGQLALALGDASAAESLCTRARDAAADVPSVRHEAAACAALARARLGLLPSARTEYIAARHAALSDPALPASERVRAGLAAAFALVLEGRAEPARGAQRLLAQIAVLPRSAQDAARLAVLRRVAVLAAAEPTPSGTVRNAAPEPEAALPDPAAVPASDPELRALTLWARARALRPLGGTAAALDALAEGTAIARDAKAPALSAALALERLVASREDVPGLVLDETLRLLAGWPAAPSDTFLDPAVPRRAIEHTIGVLARSGPDLALAGAERLRRALEGEPTDPLLDADEVRRHLAARDAVAALLVIGETRTFGWIEYPSETSALQLPAGDQLARALAPGAPAAESQAALETFLGTLVGGVSLLLVTDGFLGGVPWAALPAPESLSRAGTFVGQALHPVLLPSLEQLRDTSGARIAELSRTSRFVLVSGDGQTALDRVPHRFDRVLMAPADVAGSEAAIVQIELPLLAAGSRPETVLFRGPGGTTATLADLVPSEGVDLVTIVPPGGWADTNGSTVRAGELAVMRGARTALCARPGTAAAVLAPLYEALAAGEQKTLALDRVLQADAGLREDLVLVGHAGTRVIEPEQARWPFWATLGSGLFVLAIVVVRMLWPRRDPFEKEPPEET